MVRATIYVPPRPGCRIAVQHDDAPHAAVVAPAEVAAAEAPRRVAGVSAIYYRPLEVGDEPELVRLHEACFPVQYNDDFFASAERHTSPGSAAPLLTRAAFVDVAVCDGTSALAAASADENVGCAYLHVVTYLTPPR